MNTTLVSCAVGEVEYALRSADIVAVMRAERMRAPAASESGIGVVTVGSERVCVHSLGATIGTEPSAASPARDRHVVVLRGSTGPVGWLVDRVSRSHVSEVSDVLPLPAIVGARARRWFGGIVSTGERTMLLLSPCPTGAPEFASETNANQAFAPPNDQTPRSPAINAPLVVTFGSRALPAFGAVRYAISARRVAGIESGLQIVHVPGTELPVTGISVWRSEALPILDFGSSRPEHERDHGRLLILRGGGATTGTAVAIPVDAETALCQPTHENVLLGRSRVAGRDLPPFVVGLFDVRGQKVALIDPDALLRTAPAVDSPSENGTACSTSGRLSTPWTSSSPRLGA